MTDLQTHATEIDVLVIKFRGNYGASVIELLTRILKREQRIYDDHNAKPDAGIPIKFIDKDVKNEKIQPQGS